MYVLRSSLAAVHINMDLPQFHTLDIRAPGYTPPTNYANRRLSKHYQPNGAREVARRLRQASRIAAKRVLP